MTEFVRVGLDLAKSVFQGHAFNQSGAPVVRHKLKRSQVLKFVGARNPRLREGDRPLAPSLRVLCF